MEQQFFATDSGMLRLLDWLAGMIGMADEIGTSFLAVALPTDILKQQGGVFISWGDFGWLAVGLVILALISVAAWWVWRNQSEKDGLREEARLARQEASSTTHKYKNMEKHYNLLRQEDSLPMLNMKIDQMAEALEAGGWRVRPSGGSGRVEGQKIDPPEAHPPHPPEVLVVKEIHPPVTLLKRKAEGLEGGGSGRVEGQPSGGSGGSGLEGQMPLEEGTLGDVSRFQAETFHSKTGEMLQSQPLIDRYNQWCSERKKKPVGARIFSLKMEELGFEKKKVDGKMQWLNVAMIEKTDGNVVKLHRQ